MKPCRLILRNPLALGPSSHGKEKHNLLLNGVEAVLKQRSDSYTVGFPIALAGSQVKFSLCIPVNLAKPSLLCCALVTFRRPHREPQRS
jgi:hypothetical protein